MDIFDTLLEKGLTAFGDIQFQTSPPKVRAADCRIIMAKAQPGMVLLRGYDHFADSLCIPGQYSHSGIVESNIMSIHAIAEGVGRLDLLDFIKETDGVALLQPDPLYYDAEKAVQYARNQIGKPYDFHFQVESDIKKVDAFFCHKLTALSLAAGGIKIIPILKKIGPVVHEVYLADQFLEDPRIKTIYRC